jgi:hypothetical protein
MEFREFEIHISLEPDKPTAYGRATLRGSVVPATLCWEISERIAKNSGSGSLSGSAFEIDRSGFYE